jgi:tetraacyldisaccharide 4'-kinase
LSVQPGSRLERMWYAGEPVFWQFRLVSKVFSQAVTFNRWLYRRGWRHSEKLPVPVIVVGNISVGGTGKTPLTIALIDALRDRGLRPGVISRGYGGSVTAPTRVTATSTPAQVGDEPCLIHARTGAPMAIGRDRVAAGRLLCASGEVDVLIADDGLQHYRLCRDVEICVIDGARRFGNGRMLPAGPLRENLSRLSEVNFRVCNGGESKDDEVPMRLVLADAIALIGTQQQPLSEFIGQRVHAVAGIGNPQRFFNSLREAGVEPIEHAFSDHHAFQKGDLDFGDDLPVLMTEKDAVKCRFFARDTWWSVPARADLPRWFFSDVSDRIPR